MQEHNVENGQVKFLEPQALLMFSELFWSTRGLTKGGGSKEVEVAHKRTKLSTIMARMDLDDYPSRSVSPLPVASSFADIVVQPLFKLTISLDDDVELPFSFHGPKSFKRDIQQRSSFFFCCLFCEVCLFFVFSNRRVFEC